MRDFYRGEASVGLACAVALVIIAIVSGNLRWLAAGIVLVLVLGVGLALRRER